MKTSIQHSGLKHSVIALALFAAFGPARADDAEIAQLIKPSSSVSVGLGALSGDAAERAIFGQYNGMRARDVYGLLDLDYVTRDDASGTWSIVKGANLGLNTRELSLTREKQGDWKYSAEYTVLDRQYPRTINSAMTGAGTTTPTVVRLAAPGGGADINVGTERKAASLVFEKWISPALQFEANFKNEERTGARLWGRGYDCAAYVCGASTVAAINQANFVKNALLLVPEPIDSVTKQIDAKVNFHTEKLLISAGYYGSFFNNANGSLRPGVSNVFNTGLGQPRPGYEAVGPAIIAGGGASLQDVLQLPMALAPDNQAHQLYLDGNYSISPTTKVNFKYAYSRATQKDSFAGMGLGGAPAGIDSLNGRVDSSLAQAGFSARPIAKLSITGNVRYEHKDDKTPSALYNVEPLLSTAASAAAPATYTTLGARWDNGNTSSTRLASKLEASYRLPADVRATLGVDYSSIEREVPASIAEEKVAGLSSLRGKNWESGYRAELRRNLSETLNGAISYSSSRRSGSDWTSLNQTNSALYCGGVGCYGQELPAASIIGLSATSPFVLSQTDLQRNKWKFSADWSPIDRLDLQFVLEDGVDKNLQPAAPVVGGKGWRDSAVRLYGVDVSFALTENWKLSAYASHSEQTQHINHSTGYMADLKDLNDALGLSVTGKLSSQLDVGATVSYLDDVNKYGLGLSAPAAAPTGAALTTYNNNLAQAAIGLPNVTFRQLGLKLFAKYAVSKKSDVRVDLIHQRVKLDEWQWGSNGVPFTYADNTTVAMQPDQRLTLLAVHYIYKF